MFEVCILVFCLVSYVFVCCRRVVLLGLVVSWWIRFRLLISSGMIL